MPVAKHLTFDTLDFTKREEVDAFIQEMITVGMRGVRAETAELQAKGILDAEGNVIDRELPPDMREGSECDFGG